MVLDCLLKVERAGVRNTQIARIEMLSLRPRSEWLGSSSQIETYENCCFVEVVRDAFSFSSRPLMYF